MEGEEERMEEVWLEGVDGLVEDCGFWGVSVLLPDGDGFLAMLNVGEEAVLW